MIYHQKYSSLKILTNKISAMINTKHVPPFQYRSKINIKQQHLYHKCPLPVKEQPSKIVNGGGGTFNQAPPTNQSKIPLDFFHKYYLQILEDNRILQGHKNIDIIKGTEDQNTTRHCVKTHL